MPMSIWPAPIIWALDIPPPAKVSTYSTCVNPSSRSSVPATYIGERQMLGTLLSRMRVVSGGASTAANETAGQPSPTAAPANARKGTRLDTPIDASSTCSIETALPLDQEYASAGQ